MKINISDEIAAKTHLNERDFQEILAVSLYKLKKINGVQGGKLLGISEIEFHGLLEKYGSYLNYDEQDLAADLDTLKDF